MVKSSKFLMWSPILSKWENDSEASFILIVALFFCSSAAFYFADFVKMVSGPLLGNYINFSTEQRNGEKQQQQNNEG